MGAAVTASFYVASCKPEKAADTAQQFIDGLEEVEENKLIRATYPDWLGENSVDHTLQFANGDTASLIYDHHYEELFVCNVLSREAKDAMDTLEEVQRIFETARQGAFEIPEDATVTVESDR